MVVYNPDPVVLRGLTIGQWRAVEFFSNSFMGSYQPIMLRVSRVEVEDRWLRITLCDDGAGLNTEDMKELGEQLLEAAQSIGLSAERMVFVGNSREL